MEKIIVNREEFDLVKFMENYIKDINKFLLNRNGEREKIYLVDREGKFYSVDDNKIKDLFNEEVEIYLPVTTAVYDEMTMLNGDEVDLNEGLGAEYIEGLCYVPSSGRLIDIGDLKVSINTRVGLLLEIKKGIINFKLVQGTVDRELNLQNFSNIQNFGIVEIEVKKYLDYYVMKNK